MTNFSKGLTLITEQQLSKEQREAADLVLNKKKNIFIQGQAGTGKSAFIKYLQGHSEKNIVLCSPTAIAALNIGGVTLHSLFRLPIMPVITEEQLMKMNRKNVWNVIKAIDILIIDEISMVKPDVLDAVDQVCRKIKRNTKKAFGGIQVVLIGDLYQLPPVINKEANIELKQIYGIENPYFFDSNVYRNTKFKVIEFTKVFRQLDKTLLKNLINIRTNSNISNTLAYFNTCCNLKTQDFKNAITITPYRAVADELNQKKLAQIVDVTKTFPATLTGTFEKVSESSYPVQKVLKLKKGALIVFNKNDTDKRWVNGSMGIIKRIESNRLYIELLSNNETVVVERETWENKEYKTEIKDVFNLKTKQWEEKEVITENITGEFKQFPIQLGYAMTIHKAQGKTLDKVNIDLDKGAFAHGQLYVALSRTRTKEDMNIINKITTHDIIFDKRIADFLKT